MLLVLRSDYQSFLDDIGLPPLHYGENFYQVGRFTIAAASGFMARSGLEMQPNSLDRLLTSAAELDETPGLVRPITLNVIGYVLATGKSVAPTLDAGELVRRYIELTVGQHTIRDFAPKILEQLVTEQGTKRPQSELELVSSTSFRHGEVRAVLNGLSAAALARPLDPVQGVWELSHDFIARAVTRYLGRRGKAPLQRAVFYAAPVLLTTMLLISIGIIAWDRARLYQIRSELAEHGLTITSIKNGLAADVNPHFSRESFVSTGPLLVRLTTLRSLSLSGTTVENLEPLKGLTPLRTLDLTGTEVGNIELLKGLSGLEVLDLNKTKVKNIDPLKNLSALESLKLNETEVKDLEPLKRLISLRTLYLRGTKVDDIDPLRGLSKLEWLDLGHTNLQKIEPLKSLTALERLDLDNTKVEDLEPLKGLTALRSLNVSGIFLKIIGRTEFLRKLGRQRLGYEVMLSGVNLRNLAPLKDLISLYSLNLSGTKVDDIEPLEGLIRLQLLDLSETNVENLKPLKGLNALETLDLSGTKVGDIGAVKGLTRLQLLNLKDTQVENLEPLKGLAALQSLDLTGTKVENLEPLKGLAGLQSLYLTESFPQAEWNRLNRLREDQGLQPVSFKTWTADGGAVTYHPGASWVPQDSGAPPTNQGG
jgi:internalin A